MVILRDFPGFVSYNGVFLNPENRLMVNCLFG